ARVGDDGSVVQRCNAEGGHGAELAGVGEQETLLRTSEHGAVEARLTAVDAVDGAVVADGRYTQEKLVEPQRAEHGFGLRADERGVLAAKLTAKHGDVDARNIEQLLGDGEPVGEDAERQRVEANEP